MALIKMKELREMRQEDVRSKMRELSDELMHERGVAAMGGAPASPGKIRALRTEIARIHTVMREQELKAEKAKAAAPAQKKETKAKKGGKPAVKEEKK
ncbi:MAG: 50S ribosomal protein L29 [Thermoplasmata archaeon]|jgi:large subunit ribosomal protein L29|nr:50S ribosomal protein L29 [Thermoplasmata archaeon]